jgi:hypothetical protein
VFFLFASSPLALALALSLSFAIQKVSLLAALKQASKLVDTHTYIMMRIPQRCSAGRRVCWSLLLLLLLVAVVRCSSVERGEEPRAAISHKRRLEENEDDYILNEASSEDHIFSEDLVFEDGDRGDPDDDHPTPTDDCTAAKTCADCKGVSLSDSETSNCAWQIAPGSDTMVCLKVNKADVANQEGDMCSQHDFGGDSNDGGDSNEDPRPENISSGGDQTSLVVTEEDEGNGGAILVLFLLLLGAAGVAFKMKMSNNNQAAAKYHEM